MLVLNAQKMTTFSLGEGSVALPHMLHGEGAVSPFLLLAWFTSPCQFSYSTDPLCPAFSALSLLPSSNPCRENQDSFRWSEVLFPTSSFFSCRHAPSVLLFQKDMVWLQLEAEHWAGSTGLPHKGVWVIDWAEQSWAGAHLWHRAGGEQSGASTGKSQLMVDPLFGLSFKSQP